MLGMDLTATIGVVTMKLLRKMLGTELSDSLGSTYR